MSELRVIQIGAGFWGSSWAKVLASSECSTLEALVEIDESALHTVAESVGLPRDRRYTSLTEALSQIEADAALVVVPPDAHERVAIEALEAGLHCLVEKPLASTFAEGASIVAAGERAGRVVMVSQTFRFRKGARTVQRLIQDGAIGAIGSIHGRLFKEMHVPGFREEMEEPVIVDQAIHHFDFIRGIFGLEPVRVRAHSFNPSWSWFRGNACTLVDFETPGGAYISYSGNWVSRGGPGVNTTIDGSWDIQGEMGAIEWSHNNIFLAPRDFTDVVFRRGALERQGQILEVPLLALADEERWGVIKEFATALHEGRKPEAEGADNLKTLALVLGAVEATKREGWLELEQFVREATEATAVA